MALIDRQFMETPFFGVRQMTWHLRNDGHAVNPKRVRRLMRIMGLMPICRKPNTSMPAKGRRPLPTPRSDDRPPEPGLARRHHVSPYEAGESHMAVTS
jgi:hypothetical protein